MEALAAATAGWRCAPRLVALAGGSEEGAVALMPLVQDIAEDIRSGGGRAAEGLPAASPAAASAATNGSGSSSGGVAATPPSAGGNSAAATAASGSQSATAAVAARGQPPPGATPWLRIADVPGMVPRGRVEVVLYAEGIAIIPKPTGAAAAAAAAATGAAGATSVWVPIESVTGVFNLEVKDAYRAGSAAATQLLVIMLATPVVIGKAAEHRAVAFADTGAALAKAGRASGVVGRDMPAAAFVNADAVGRLVTSADGGGGGAGGGGDGTLRAGTRLEAEHALALLRGCLAAMCGTVGEADTALFRSAAGAPSIKCYYKVNDGVLFPLRRCFLFGMKPLLCIPHTDIAAVAVARSGGTVTRTFDVDISMLDGKTVQFSMIDNAELDALRAYVGKRTWGRAAATASSAPPPASSGAAPAAAATAVAGGAGGAVSPLPPSGADGATAASVAATRNINDASSVEGDGGEESDDGSDDDDDSEFGSTDEDDEETDSEGGESGSDDDDGGSSEDDGDDGSEREAGSDGTDTESEGDTGGGGGGGDGGGEDEGGVEMVAVEDDELAELMADARARGDVDGDGDGEQRGRLTRGGKRRRAAAGGGSGGEGVAPPPASKAPRS